MERMHDRSRERRSKDRRVARKILSNSDVLPWNTADPDCENSREESELGQCAIGRDFRAAKKIDLLDLAAASSRDRAKKA